ncbi:MAG TPA: rhomboid family intramembrane serine protease [Terriglobales bacterium]|nr:rhomboid family intramembrane serine protease [Terriglobales bacterium]
MPPRRRIGSDQGMTLSFPPFTRVVLWLMGINTCVYLFLEILSLSRTTLPFARYFALGSLLIPQQVLHGEVWRIVTYCFLHQGFLYLFFSMLQLWMFGAQLEQTWGWKRFAKFYFICVIGAALAAMALSYLKLLGLSPTSPIAGSAGGVFGVLMAFGILFADTEIFMFPFPVTIKAKYMVGILVVITVILAMNEAGGIGNVAQLGGLLTGFLYIKLGDRGSRKRYAPGVYPGRGLSDRIFEPTPVKKPSLFARWRDSYYRWKRRRAARKFEVYMRKHDRQVYFDEHGNYIDPESAEGRRREEDESKKPWIN